MKACPNPTKYEIRLYRKLRERGVDARLKYWDGSRYVDIAIPDAGIYVHIRTVTPGSGQVYKEHVPAGNGQDAIGSAEHFHYMLEELKEGTSRIAGEITAAVRRGRAGTG